MRKTANELLEFLGLKIGDRVKVEGATLTVRRWNNWGVILFRHETNTKYWLGLHDLCTREYQIIEDKMRVGDTCCGEYSSNCNECPIGKWGLLCPGLLKNPGTETKVSETKLYNILELYEKKYPRTQYITDIIKKELEEELKYEEESDNR